MRLLHARVHRRGQGAARREPEPDRGRDALLAGRQSLPLHRLRQDHPRRARRRRGHAQAEAGTNESYLDKASLKVVGTRPIRPDGVDKVTGRANFGADMAMPGMLWGKVKRSPHAHARILSIDTDKALALPGVKAVITARRFPRHDAGAGVYRRRPGQSCATCRATAWRRARRSTRATRSPPSRRPRRRSPKRRST